MALRNRYPGIRVEQLDLDLPCGVLGNTTYDIVYCYGTLYHLSKPAEALEYMAKHCTGMLLLETCVSHGDEESINHMREDQQADDQSLHGSGCRPTRTWVWNALKTLFEHVYVPKTQPDHPEFPLDWRRPPGSGYTRSVFVASRTPLGLSVLTTELLERQTK